MFKLVKVSFIKSLENANKELLKEKTELIKKVDKLELELKNEKHKNLLLNSAKADLECGIIQLKEKYIPKQDKKTGKFTSKK
jgi:hypothetical protein